MKKFQVKYIFYLKSYFLNNVAGRIREPSRGVYTFAEVEGEGATIWKMSCFWNLIRRKALEVFQKNEYVLVCWIIFGTQ